MSGSLNAASSSRQAAPSSPHSKRFTALIIVLIIVLAIAAGAANAFWATHNDGRPYSPYSYDPDGVAALSALLEHEGIEVIHAQTEQSLAEADASSTVVLTSPSDVLHMHDSEEDTLADSQGDDSAGGDGAETHNTEGTATEKDLDNADASEYGQVFDDLIESKATIILLGHDSFWNGQAWGFDADSWTSENYDPAEDSESALLSEKECAGDIPFIDDDGSSIGPVNQILIRSGSNETCFNTLDGTAWARSAVYPHVYYFGASSIFTNEYLSQHDNAGAAMRMLGQHPKLLWVEGYVPELGDEQLIGELPEWFTLAFIALLASGLWLSIWRWRRFGTLVAEPLPVIVPAQEANEGRARMYRSGGDAAHAARVLRAGFISRYASRLGLSQHSSPDAVVEAFANYLHSDEKIIAETLYTYPVNTDADLAHAASALGTLEKEFTHVSTAV